MQPKQCAETLLASLMRRSGESPASLAVAGWSLAEDIQVSDDIRAKVKRRIVGQLQEGEGLGSRREALRTSSPVGCQRRMRA